MPCMWSYPQIPEESIKSLELELHTLSGVRKGQRNELAYFREAVNLLTSEPFLQPHKVLCVWLAGWLTS